MLSLYGNTHPLDLPPSRPLVLQPLDLTPARPRLDLGDTTSDRTPTNITSSETSQAQQPR